ncbi:7559_t:CDS:2 [Funneliformis geosporum]|uniref:7559_t:CDS:1 n=1 Tax=Funneliformis geosporum TaxID=1117311 RepID=A0A9W4SXP1_9GLOM|nr:7559_t:CDS:2 [Funneliformis geosporum]
MIQELKLNHGLFLDGHSIIPSKQAIFAEHGELCISLYKEQPIVYTPMNLLSNNFDKDNFNNDLQSYDACVNFPVAEIIYKGDLLESFLEHDEKLHELYGHVFARKVLLGGKLFIKEFNSITQKQVDIFKFLLLSAYNFAKFNTLAPLNKFSVSRFLPKVETLNGKMLDTPEKLFDWISNLYQKDMFDIISYNDLIPVSQLRSNSRSEDNFKALLEKQPRVVNFKEKLSLEDWVGNANYVNLIAAKFVQLPNIESRNRCYLEVIRPTTNVEERLINNNIFSIKDLKPFPFVNDIESDNPSNCDYDFLVKFEQYEIVMNQDHITPSAFEQAINEALKNVNPFNALQSVFDEFGHWFPQKIILGRCFKRKIPNPDFDKIDLESPKFENLKPYLDNLNLSYLLTGQGNIIQNNELSDLMRNLNSQLLVLQPGASSFFRGL